MIINPLVRCNELQPCWQHFVTMLDSTNSHAIIRSLFLSLGVLAYIYLNIFHLPLLFFYLC